MQNSLAPHPTLRQPLLERLDARIGHLVAVSKIDLLQLLAVLRQCDDARIGHLVAPTKIDLAWSATPFRLRGWWMRSACAASRSGPRRPSPP